MHNSFSYMFISILCMFRAPMCSSSGESIVLIRHLVYVTLCKWPSSVQVWFYPNLLYKYICIYLFICLFILIIYMFRAPLCSSSGESIVLIRRYIYLFISILYMFRAPLYSSLGESIVLIRHLVYVTICRWPSSVQVWFHPNLHTWRSPTYSDIHQMSY